MARAALALVLVLAAQPAPAQEAALRLEALAERIAKLHAQLGQNVLAARARRALPEAMRDFDSALRAATAAAPNVEARENYALLVLQWHDYRAWAQKPATRDNAKRLADRVEEVAWTCAKGARMAVAPGRASGGDRATLAMHAATLSQRVARLHLLRHWGLRGASIDAPLAEAARGLRSTLEQLRQSASNTPATTDELQVALDQLGFLDQAVSELADGHGTLRQMEFIAKAGDNILESMQRVARLYEGGVS